LDKKITAVTKKDQPCFFSRRMASTPREIRERTTPNPGDFVGVVSVVAVDMGVPGKVVETMGVVVATDVFGTWVVTTVVITVVGFFVVLTGVL